MKILLNLVAVGLLLGVMLLASIDLEPSTPTPPVEYDIILETTSDEVVFSREAEEVEFETYHVTAYCICEECCGKTDGIGASGIKVQPGISVAGVLPFGTKVWIEGIGFRTVQDRGSAISENELDILLNSHSDALNFGSQYLKVRIVND